MTITNHDQFAHAGNPWATISDWIRETQIAANPKASDREREKAIAYTKRASMSPKKAEPKPEFRQDRHRYPVSDQALQMQHQREVLKQMLNAGTGNPASRTMASYYKPVETAVRVLSSSEELRYRNAGERAEPASYGRPEPVVDVDQAKHLASRKAHWQTLRVHWQKAHDQAVTLGDAVAAKRSAARLVAIDTELEILSCS